MPTDDLKPVSIFSCFRQISDLPEIQKLKSRADVMESLRRIREFSEENRASVHISSLLYHASLHAGLEILDPEKGQGFGIWMQPKLKEAAHFAVSRSTNPNSGQRYEGVSPTIYEIEPNFKNLAIFPNESALYAFSVCEEDPYLGIDYHQMRKLLQSEGFDGIFLLKEQTVSAIVSSSITVKQEHDAVPFYIDLVRPELLARFGKDPLLAP